MAAIQIVQNGLNELLERIAHQLDVKHEKYDVGDLVGGEDVGENQPFDPMTPIEAKVPVLPETNPIGILIPPQIGEDHPIGRLLLAISLPMEIP